MSVRVKICGINDAAGFDAAVEAGADWVGFVFFPPSPRYVTPAIAAGLSARVVGGPGRVGLFVDPTEAEMASVLAIMPLDVVQVYWSGKGFVPWSPSPGPSLWRALGVTTAADLPATAENASGFVIEAKPPAGATRPGGNAVAFDWHITQGWHAPAPWLLAGGLTPENVAAAIDASGAKAVDVSSGVERARGVKDPALIRAFIRAAQAAGTGASDTA